MFYFTKHAQRKGGAAILIASKWAPFISESRCSPCTRVVWVTIINDDINLVCVLQTPQITIGRKVNCENGFLPLSNVPWIIGGDLNMVEQKEDKIGGNPKSWKRNELYVWEKSKRFLNL